MNGIGLLILSILFTAGVLCDEAPALFDKVMDIIAGRDTE